MVKGIFFSSSSRSAICVACLRLLLLCALCAGCVCVCVRMVRARARALPDRCQVMHAHARTCGNRHNTQTHARTHVERVGQVAGVDHDGRVHAARKSGLCVLCVFGFHRKRVFVIKRARAAKETKWRRHTHNTTTHT
jgi:hypothetical protein